MQGKIILITGGAGAIGSNLALALARQNKVIVIDDLSSGHLSNVENVQAINDFEFIKGSILDFKLLKDVFEKNKIDVVFHLASFFANQNSIDHPELDLQVNGLGTLKLLEFCKHYEINKFVYASSSCIYASQHTELKEGVSVEGNNNSTPYAITKYLGETYTKFYSDKYNLNSTVLRYFNSYGPGEYPGKYRNVIPNFIARALDDEDLIITGTGSETRDFTFVDDIVNGTILAGESAIDFTFNIGSSTKITIKELAKKIIKKTNSKSKILYKGKRDWDKTKHRCSNIDNAKSLLGYIPVIDLDQGLDKTIQWFLNNNLKEER